MSTSKPEEKLCPLPADTEALAEALAKELKAGDVVLLAGPLGAGKTCFTRGLAKGLGYAPSDVLSPTFQLVRELHGGRLPLHHIDLYRLSVEEVGRLGLSELFNGEGVCAVEWPERLEGLTPKGCYKVALDGQEDGARRVTLEKP